MVFDDPRNYRPHVHAFEDNYTPYSYGMDMENRYGPTVPDPLRMPRLPNNYERLNRDARNPPPWMDLIPEDLRHNPLIHAGQSPDNISLAQQARYVYYLRMNSIYEDELNDRRIQRALHVSPPFGPHYTRNPRARLFFEPDEPEPLERPVLRRQRHY